MIVYENKAPGDDVIQSLSVSQFQGNGGFSFINFFSLRVDGEKIIWQIQVRQGMFEGDLSSFVARFLEGRTEGYGGWHGHVASWLDSPVARKGDLLVVRYEEMRRDPLGTMRKVVATLGLTTPDEAIRRVIETNTMERMRGKEASATVVKKKRDDIPIVRKGKPGEWREVLGEGDRAAFVRRAGPMLARLGYDVEGG